MAHQKVVGKGICCVKGQYRRTIGKWVNSSGKLAPRRFLLGRDRRKAEQANLRLEQLWQIVCEGHAVRARSAPPLPSPADLPAPHWDGIELQMAEAIRKHEAAIRVGELDEAHTDAGYAAQLHWLNETYGAVIRFVPAMPDSHARGQEEHAQWAEHRARQAATNASIANAPIPTIAGQTLYEAIDAYADHSEATGSGGASEPKDARGLKNSAPDVTLDRFNYDAILQMADYWRSRPAARRPGAKGKPIAARTVVNRLKTMGRLIRWMHRSDSWKWKRPDGVDEALRVNTKKLLTEEELLAQARGPATWDIPELATLYGYATDRERVLLLMGLNLGFAQSEIISMRKVDFYLEDDPPRVARVRSKTGKYFEAALWPETIRAFEWLAEERSRCESGDNPWVVLTERGHRPKGQGIRNMWNRLLDRVQKDQPDFRRLPFKQLRKTAYQFVLEASGSLEIAGTFEGRGQLSTDKYADVYGRRLFEKVFAANTEVRKRLAPMLKAARNAFEAPRKRGGSNVSRRQVRHIEKLWLKGHTANEIARLAGVSRTTAYRHRPDCQSDG